jgi:phenylpropionate dioxygenase-like ring-hydroxylating dioxygenase large terminal subunit
MADNFLDIAHVPGVHTGTGGRAPATALPPLPLEPLDASLYGYRYPIDATNPDTATVTSGNQAPVVTRWMTTGFPLPFTIRSTIRYATGLEHML